MTNPLSPRLPQPTPPPLPRQTSGRYGYAHALAFFALLFGVYAATAVLDGAAQWGAARDWAAWADHRQRLGLWVTLAALTLWLAAGRARHCQVWAALFTCAIIGELLTTGGRMNTLPWLYDVLATIAATILATTLARGHGLSIGGFGIGRPRSDHATRRQADMVLWYSLGGSAAANLVGFAVTWLGLPHGLSPLGRHYSVYQLAIHIVAAGVCEELLMAVVVVALAAARRPAWEIYTLSMLMRLSYHMYYQAVAPSVLVMGVVNLWLYRRTGRLTPLIVAHITWDLCAWARSEGPVWAAATTAAVLAIDLLVGTWWVGKPAADSQQDPALTTAQ